MGSSYPTVEMVVCRSRINRLSGTLQPLGKLWNDAVINLQAVCSSVEQHDVTPGHEIG
ncbi:hypothetical protein K1Y80_44770 [Streptomyces sp. MAG02]|nr:hypothetical protein [Streptomyces sp. MAG02]